MKQIAMLSGILFFFSFANGQITKGTILIGGQVSYSDADNKYNYVPTNTSYYQETSSKNASVSISIGKAFKDNSVDGISVGFSPSSSNMHNYYYDYIDSALNAQTSKTNTYSMSIFHRNYKKIFHALYLFNEVGVGFSYSHLNATDSIGAMPNTANTFSGNIYFSPGIAYRIRKKIDLELTIPSLVKLAYTASNNVSPEGDLVEDTKSHTFGLSTNLSFSSLAFGVKIIL